jgi:nucleotide-binding universal stress UspA family protein
MGTVNFKKILIPTDFSETGMLALEHGTFMARLMKAQLCLMHAVEGLEYAYSIYEPEVIVTNMSGVDDIVQEKLERIATQIARDHCIHVDILLSHGRASMEITGLAKENAVDIIIMGTQGTDGMQEYIIGSNAQRVVNNAPCPVITVQQHAKKLGFTNIVMPIDNSTYSRQKVDYVVALAKMYGSKVHLLGLLNYNESVDEKVFEQKMNSIEVTLKGSRIFYTRKLIKGKNIAEEAMKYSELVNADLLVIMNDHEAHLKETLFGSLARQIVNHSKIPVMSIQPKANEVLN